MHNQEFSSRLDRRLDGLYMISATEYGPFLGQCELTGKFEHASGEKIDEFLHAFAVGRGCKSIPVTNSAAKQPLMILYTSM